MLMWTGLNVEELLRIVEDCTQWNKVVQSVGDPWVKDGWRQDMILVSVLFSWYKIFEQVTQRLLTVLLSSESTLMYTHTDRDS